MAAVATLIWYKWLYRQVLEKTVAELQELMAAIERHLAREQLFRAEPEASLRFFGDTPETSHRT